MPFRRSVRQPHESPGGVIRHTKHIPSKPPARSIAGFEDLLSGHTCLSARAHPHPRHINLLHVQPQNKATPTSSIHCNGGKSKRTLVSFFSIEESASSASRKCKGGNVKTSTREAHTKVHRIGIRPVFQNTEYPQSAGTPHVTFRPLSCDRHCWYRADGHNNLCT